MLSYPVCNLPAPPHPALPAQIGYIQLLLPGSCLVAVARHPLDAGLSCYSQPFGYSGVPWAWSLEHIGEQVGRRGDRVGWGCKYQPKLNQNQRKRGECRQRR